METIVVVIPLANGRSQVQFYRVPRALIDHAHRVVTESVNDMHHVNLGWHACPTTAYTSIPYLFP